jgi:hypothetical protein
VADRDGSRIAQATGGAGERGSRFGRAQQKSARSCALLTRGKIGGNRDVLVRGPVRHGTMGSLRREKETKVRALARSLLRESLFLTAVRSAIGEGCTGQCSENPPGLLRAGGDAGGGQSLLRRSGRDQMRL